MAIQSPPRAETIATVLDKPLAIPNYQRPYKWQPKHVNQLVDDIFQHRDKSRYRLGTVVLFKSKDQQQPSIDIVDGQQRLLTLTLICSALNNEHKQFSPTLLGHSFSSKASIANLQHNAQLIFERFAGLNDPEKEELLTFVLERCELVVVTLDNLSEAFQFFDSQNARGKALEPYDLLKAYHLREMMEFTEQSERLHHVRLWEEGVNPENGGTNLHQIMGEFLFRMRRWIDGGYGIQFSRHNIDVFKGINLENTHYAYAETMLALDYAIQQYNDDPMRKWDKQHKAYPFQVDQVMINGKRFFEYIQHYLGIHKVLFDKDTGLLENFTKEYLRYPGHDKRSGDQYVNNLFKCAVMHYYDKFGEHELLNAAKICFRWSYYLRVQLQSIGMSSIDNHARDSKSVFRVIAKAIHPQQVLSFQPPYSETVRYAKAQVIQDSIQAMISGGLNDK